MLGKGEGGRDNTKQNPTKQKTPTTLLSTSFSNTYIIFSKNRETEEGSEIGKSLQLSSCTGA